MGNPRPYKEVRAKMAAKRGQGRPKAGTGMLSLPREPAPPSVLPPAAPTPGRIVQVHRTVGLPVPAIVTQVHVQLADEVSEGTPPTVSLVVFDAMHGENAMPAEALRWVRHGTAPGQWTWPVRT